MDVDALERLTRAAYAAADPGAGDALRAAAGDVERGDAAPARYAAVRGNAYLVANKLSAHRTDLDLAITWLGTAVELGATPSRCANLAAALLERSGIDGGREDHERAVALLREALAEREITASTEATRSISLLGAYVDGVERGYGDVTLDELIDYGESVVERFAGLQSGEPENLLGSAYLLAAQRGHGRTDLDRMVHLLERAVSLLDEGHPDLPARQSNLGAALLDRHEIAGRPDDLPRAVELTLLASTRFPEHHPSKPQALNNHLNAVTAEYERCGDAALLVRSLPLLAPLVRAYRPGHPLYPVALANAGLFARQAAHALERDDLLDLAIECHEAAIADTAEDGPALKGRLASLALAFADRYARTDDPDDLERAIVFGTQSLGSTVSHDVELSGFAVNVGNFLHDRYSRYGRVSDLHAAAAMHDRGLRGVSQGHHDRASMLNNAGIVSLDLHDRLGNPSDLERAASYLAESVWLSSETDPELASRLINLATVRNRQATYSHSEERLAEAEELAARATRVAVRSKIRTVARGLLVDVQRNRWRLSGDQADLDRLVELDGLVAPATPAAHLRRGISRGLAGDRDGETRYLRVALDHGLESRPAVAISAAQLLADHGLRLLAAGERRGLDIVEEAAAAAIAARNRLVETGEGRRADLSWHRDLTGFGALWAHARWLAKDSEGALSAFEETGSVLLSVHVPDAPPLDATFVALWASPVGGAAVVARPGCALVPVELPHLTTDAANRMADRLSMAARLGPRSLDPVLAATGLRLGRMISRPLFEALRPREPVVCAAGGPVGLLPIGLGETRDGPLVTHNPIIRALNRRSAAWAHHAAERKDIDMDDAVSIASPATSALPPLPASARESRLFAPADRRRHGQTATPEAVLDAFRSANVVHVATHVGSPAGDPLAQHFLLADDRPLFADAVLEAAPLEARLAVLAGCATGRTVITHADEGLALASAVHAAGVPAVISSLWSVFDPLIARMMRRLVTDLRDGLQPAQALHKAQLTAISEGRNTSEWAPFILLGR